MTQGLRKQIDSEKGMQERILREFRASFGDATTTSNQNNSSSSIRRSGSSSLQQQATMSSSSSQNNGRPGSSGRGNKY